MVFGDLTKTFRPLKTSMADYTVVIAIPDHKRGDKWEGLSVGPVKINYGAGDVTPELSLTRVKMHFRLRSGPGKGSSAIYRIDSDASTQPDAPATILNAATWLVDVPEIASGFLSRDGVWDWDMEFFETGKAAPITFYKGALTIHNDTTR